MILKIFKDKSGFTLRNPFYLKELNRILIEGLKMDLGGRGDITSKFVLGKKNPLVIAKITAKENGIFAGKEDGEYLLKDRKCKIKNAEKDGKKFSKGDLLMEIEGKAKNILSIERILLNLLQRSSGIATLTSQMVSKIPKNILLSSTRKTLWGMIDKKSVLIGGGGSHRFGLFDAVLIKNNHFKVADYGLQIVKLSKIKNIKFVEIEVNTVSMAKKVIDQIKETKFKMPFILMLDNFNPFQITKVVEFRQGCLSGIKNFYIEVSGGINKKNIENYAIHGIDIISSGALTNSVRAIDMNLTINSCIK